MRKITAIGLLAVFTPISVQAQGQALPPAVAACYSQPAICAVIGATVGGWLIVRNGQQLLCTYANCRPFQQRPRMPREMRSEGESRPQDYGVTTPDRCSQILERLRRAGYKARLLRARRNNIGSGGVLEWICEIETNAPTNFYPGSFRGRDY